MRAPSEAEILGDGDGDGDGDVDSALDAEPEADGDPEADVELEADGDTDPAGDPVADAESEADAEPEAEGHADPELDPDGEGSAVLVPAVPDDEGVGEVLAEADGDGDGDVVREGVGDGDGEAEGGSAWQLVSVFGDELGVWEAGDDVGLGVAATGLSEPARAMAGHAISTAMTSKHPASKLSVVALTCVNRI